MFNWFPYHLLLQKISTKSSLRFIAQRNMSRFKAIPLQLLCFHSVTVSQQSLWAKCPYFQIVKLSDPRDGMWVDAPSIGLGVLIPGQGHQPDEEICVVWCFVGLPWHHPAHKQVLAATQWFDLYVYITGSLVLTYILPGRGWKKTCQESYQAESGKGLGKWWKTFH